MKMAAITDPIMARIGKSLAAVGTATGEATGRATGEATGDTTGDLTGDTTGEATGATGEATGEATGAATGETTGAATGAATGEATGAATGEATGGCACNPPTQVNSSRRDTKQKKIQICCEATNSTRSGPASIPGIQEFAVQSTECP